MARKKMVKKKVVRRASGGGKITEPWKFRVVLKNLFLFIILFALSFVLYNASSNILYENLFFLLSLIFGFIAVAFLLVYLILLFLRGMGR